MRRSLASILVFGLAMTHQSLSAQTADQARAAILDSWQEFTASRGIGWHADWNVASGTPRAIYGPGLRLQADPVETLVEARRLAAAALEDHAALLGRGQSNFVEIIGAKAARVWVFVYEQQYRGLPVIGGRADLRIHENGVLSMFGSIAAQIPADFSVRPGIGAQLAEFRAYRDRDIVPKPPGPLANQQARARLVIWTDLQAKGPGPLFLAWEIKVDQRSDDLVVGTSYVDAQTGRVLAFRDDVYSCAGHGEEPHTHDKPAKKAKETVGITGSVRAWANTGLRPIDPLSNIPMPRLRIVAGSTTVFTDALGNFSIPDTDAAFVQFLLSGEHVGNINVAQGRRILFSQVATSAMPLNIQLLDAGATEFDWTQTTVYWATDDVNNWVRGIMQPNPPQLSSISRISATVNIDASCNAFYSGNTINFYPTQGGCNTTAFSTVIYHEWGHGLDDTFGGISQVDGLSEGWGDILAMFRSRQPIVGANFTVTGGFLRTGTNSRTFPSAGGVHTQGQTWMGFAWDVRSLLIGTLGPVAGEARAEEIFINAIIADAKNQPDAVREVFLLDDDDGNLNNGTPNYLVLKAAAEARNLPFPALMEVIVDHDGLVATREDASPRLVRATITPVLGSVLSAEVVYDSGAGVQRRNMVTGQGTNEYLAILPAIPSPGRVGYHFEIRHSGGNLLRRPSTGEFFYEVGEEVEVFADDFESGGIPWAHGVLRTEDDWQQGQPLGGSGVSGGVAWSDPSSAPSGNTVFGNDLGTVGSYGSNVSNFLRSPLFDMTGRSGLTLNFKRWLTVEQGIFDQATITVNGVSLWANPLATHHIDTGWSEQTILLPSSLDNNPAVQFTWNLVTDGSLELGGWNIDDVRLLAVDPVPAPALEFTMTPAQIDIGTSSQVHLQGTPNVLVAIALSDSPGPTVIPGLVTLQLGTLGTVRSFFLDSQGELDLTFNAPTDPSAVGSVTYAQAIELTNMTTLTPSNPMVFLISQ